MDYAKALRHWQASAGTGGELVVYFKRAQRTRHRGAKPPPRMKREEEEADGAETREEQQMGREGARVGQLEQQWWGQSQQGQR